MQEGTANRALFPQRKLAWYVAMCIGLRQSTTAFLPQGGTEQLATEPEKYTVCFKTKFEEKKKSLLTVP